MHFLLLFFGFLWIASPGQARVSPAVGLLDRLTHEYEQSPTEDKRGSILKFVFTGDSGEHGPYKKLSKRKANDEERAIMLRALDIVNRHAAARNAEDNIFDSYLTISATASEPEAEARHKLICFMAVHSVFGKASHFSLKQIGQNFRSKYWDRIKLSYGFDEKEVDGMFERLYDSLSFEDDEEYRKPAALPVERIHEKHVDEKKTQVVVSRTAKDRFTAPQIDRDEAATRIQALARGRKVRAEGEKEYDKMTRELDAMVDELREKREAKGSGR